MARRLVCGSTALGMLLTVALATSAGAARPALDKDEYIVAADNICAQADQLRDEAAQDVFAALPEGSEPTFDQLSEYVAGITPINDQQLDGLRALPAPDADAKKLKKIYKKVEKAFDAIVDDPNVLLTGPDPFAKPNKAAQKYGFEVCGAETTD